MCFRNPFDPDDASPGAPRTGGSQLSSSRPSDRSLYPEQIQILDADDNRKYHISGFDSVQEAKAAQAILQGQALSKRHVNIKMQDSAD